jgi:hypothetical protein
MATRERERLAIKGKRQPNGGMLEQSEHSIKVGETHEAKLATVGITARMLREMGEKRSEVAQPISAQSQGREAARGVTRNEVRVVSQVRGVAKVEEELKARLGGESSLATHDPTCEELGAVAGTQAERVANPPEQTFGLDEAKGRLIELADHSNRLGHVASIDRAESAGRFDGGVSLRNPRRGAGAGEATSALTARTPDAKPQ